MSENVEIALTTEEKVLSHIVSKGKIYNSNEEALEDVKKIATIYGAAVNFKNVKNSGRLNQPLSLNDMTNILEQFLSFAIIGVTPGMSVATGQLWIYNYDEKRYDTHSDILDRYLRAMSDNIISNSKLQDIIRNLKVSPHAILPAELSASQLPFKNGIYDYKNEDFIEASPKILLSSYLNIDYKKIDVCPEITPGKNVLDLIMDVANNDHERYIGLLQVIKQSIVGKTLDNSFVLLLGEGGSGKSTIMKLITNIVGQNNVSNIKLDEFGNDNRLLKLNSARVCIGDDNKDAIHVGSMENLKTLTGGNSISISRKYMTDLSLNFPGVIIQGVARIPRFDDANEQLRRRLVVYPFEKSFVNNPDKLDYHLLDKYLDDNDVKAFLVNHVMTMPELMDQKEFIGWDKALAEEVVDLNNPIGEFIEIFSDTDLFNIDILPTDLLYAAYLDYFEINGNSKHVNNKAGFLSKIRPELKKFGYTKMSGITSRVKSALKNVGRIVPGESSVSLPEKEKPNYPLTQEALDLATNTEREDFMDDLELYKNMYDVVTKNKTCKCYAKE